MAFTKNIMTLDEELAAANLRIQALEKELAAEKHGRAADHVTMRCMWKDLEKVRLALKKPSEPTWAGRIEDLLNDAQNLCSTISSFRKAP
jgi:hypothetical protein